MWASGNIDTKGRSTGSAKGLAGPSDEVEVERVGAEEIPISDSNCAAKSNSFSPKLSPPSPNPSKVSIFLFFVVVFLLRGVFSGFVGVPLLAKLLITTSSRMLASNAIIRCVAKLARLITKNFKLLPSPSSSTTSISTLSEGTPPLTRDNSCSTSFTCSTCGDKIT